MQNNGKSCGGTVIKNSVFAFLPGGNRGGGSSFFLVLTQILVLVVVGFFLSKSPNEKRIHAMQAKRVRLIDRMMMTQSIYIHVKGKMHVQ